MIKIAFWFDAPPEYTGGVNYLSNLLYAVSLANKGEIACYVFISSGSSDLLISRFDKYANVVKTDVLKRRSLMWLLHKILYKVFKSMLLPNKIFSKYKIKVVSHVWIPYHGKKSIKVVSWIPDFQYMHLPEMFPGLRQEDLNKYNREIINNSDAIIVSSQHSLKDLYSLCPRQELPLTKVLNFVSQIPDCNNKNSIFELEQKYGFSGKYFLLPNQFWAHKNHGVVLEAIAAAKLSGMSLTVLMTGNPRDYRLVGTPYLDDLKHKIASLGIEEEARILGMINYDDLSTLMRNCVAFLNPSRFEGWSSSVEEARSLGKPILLSRIPVHLEQAPELGFYFNCDNAEELKNLMIQRWMEHNLVNHQARAERARTGLRARTHRFATEYLRLIKTVVD